jgi:molecular chaperone GrpE (heat shock protein)
VYKVKFFVNRLGTSFATLEKEINKWLNQEDIGRIHSIHQSFDSEGNSVISVWYTLPGAP